MRKSGQIIATPPGATVKEQLLNRGMSQKEFAIRMDMSEKHISRLINGEVQLTCEMAVRLETVLGVPAEFWNQLEAIYREKLIKIKLENEIELDMEIAEKLPYEKLSRAGWVPDAPMAQDRVLHLRKYFELVQLRLLENPQVTRIACRKSPDCKIEDYELIAWAQRAKLEARKIVTESVDRKALGHILPRIQELMDMPVCQFESALTGLLAKYGVAVVILPAIGSSFLHGATFPDGNRIVMGLTLEEDDPEKFWFSFFHELGHIVLGHIDQPQGTSEADEMAADAFAEEAMSKRRSPEAAVRQFRPTG